MTHSQPPAVAALPPEAEPQPPYLKTILRWLSVTLSIFILVTLAGVYITDHLLPRVYTATVQIDIIPAGLPAIPSPASASETPESLRRDFMQTQMTTMRSSQILQPTIKELGLEKSWAKQMGRPDELTDDEALAYLDHHTKVGFRPGTTIAGITISSRMPQEAADIANAIATRYKALRDAELDERVHRAEDALREDIAQQQKVVDAKRAAFLKGQNTSSPADPDAQRELQQQQALLEAFNTRLRQIASDDKLRERPVRIISLAVAPTEPTHPNKSFDFMVTLVGAGFVALIVASFVEVVMLLTRASKRP